MKSALSSKMIWVNILTLIVGTVGYVAGHDVMSQYPQVVAALVAAQGAINVALRFFTWEPISLKGVQ